MAEPIPANLLEGLTLDSGWVVSELLEKGPDATGGAFSSSYFVQRQVNDLPIEHGFLKALDLSSAFSMPMSIVDALQHLTNAYVHERDLVLRCASERMGSVVIGIEAGEVTLTDASVNPLLRTVPYLIFERGEGDLRKVMDKKLASLEEAWVFRVMHGVANGLRQLHWSGISHQDIKPSNVMSFGDESKVGDLGRSCLRDRTGFYDSMPFAGDLAYAPPEYLYGAMPTDYWTGRRASDAYQLGGLLVFLLSGTGMTALIQKELGVAFHWSTWPYPYENVLPFVRDAFDTAVSSITETLRFDKSVIDHIDKLIRELCDPDPALRGMGSRGSRSGQHSMERYVSRFDSLAIRAQRGIKSGGVS